MDNFYAVRHGRQPGIYSSWDECQPQVHRFRGAQYQRFDSYEDAEQYVRTGEAPSAIVAPPPCPPADRRPIGPTRVAVEFGGRRLEVPLDESLRQGLASLGLLP